jgi:alcohol dehydrogenase
VVTDTGRMFKMTMGDPRMAPIVAYVDPALTVSVPKGTTAATGMDALTHAIEAYTCTVHNPVSDGLALRAIRMIAKHLVPAVDDGGNLAAREGMMYASTIAGMAFGNADVAAVHCISEAIGGLYDTPHGVANSVFLPWVFDFNKGADPHRHADVAEALGIARDNRTDDAVAAEGARLLGDLSERIGIPRFADLQGIDPADFARLAEASEANGSTPSNARPISRADYRHILERAYAG